METIRQILFTGWNFARWFRLAFGTVFIVEAIQIPYILLAIVGGVFVFTALFNIGCGGTCGIPVRRTTTPKPGKIDFEELKNN